jgi:hypothetical protein
VRLPDLLLPKHLQHRISAITLNIVTMTVVIALTIAMKTLAMAEMMELRPRPIAEKIEPMMTVLLLWE